MTAGEIYPVYFPIIPTETGDLKINITVISTGPSDAVIRYLKVEVGTTTNTYRSDLVILSLKYYFILMVYALILLFVFFGYALFFFRSNIFHSNQIFVAPIFYSPRELKRNSTTLFWSTPAQRGPSFNRSLCPSPPRRWRALVGSGPLSSVGNGGKRLLTNVFVSHWASKIREHPVSFGQQATTCLSEN